MSNVKCYKKGFTLIELLVAIGVALILVSSAITITILVRRTVAKSSDKLEAVQNTRSIVDRISRDLRQANYMITLLNEYQVAGVMGEPIHQIEFENGHDSVNPNYIRYYLNETNIIREEYHYYFSISPETWVRFDARDGLNQPPIEEIDSKSTVANYVSQFDLWKNTDNFIIFKITANKNNESSSMLSQILLRNL